MNYSRMVAIPLFFGLYYFGMASPRAQADSIKFDETIVRDTVTTTCDGGSGNSLPESGFCEISFFNLKFEPKTLTFEFTEPNGGISDTLIVSLIKGDPNEAILTASYTSDAAGDSLPLGTAPIHITEKSGTQLVDISSLGLPIKEITVVNDAETAETPEPSSLVLMGTGLVGLAAAVRRKLLL